MPPRIRCRQVGDADTAAVAELLSEGFRKRSREFWVRALRRLSEHPTPPGFPKYGYLLESDGELTGVLLLIASTIDENGAPRIRCNVSSWYVRPPFRGYAGMLVSHALKQKQATYYNITPDLPTLPILEAQGYEKYCEGRFVAVPALAPRRRNASVGFLRPGTEADHDLSPFEADLLARHVGYGCLSVICSHARDRHPFVFLPRRKAGLLPFVYLSYCRHLQEFVRFAGPLGRFLARHGYPLVVVDANGPVPGLVGKYSGGAPKYFRGPNQPRLGDIAYSERVMFGY